jgi:hypothetical protein
MRDIIAIFAALLALACLFSATGEEPLMDPSQSNLTTTQSIASFLSNTWTPGKPEAPIFTASAANKKGYIENTSLLIFDFLNDDWKPGSYVPPVEKAAAAFKGGNISQAGDFISQFWEDTWTPSWGVEAVTKEGPYTKHQMS